MTSCHKRKVNGVIYALPLNNAVTDNVKETTVKNLVTKRVQKLFKTYQSETDKAETQDFSLESLETLLENMIKY